jgi:WD40 repeat protein
MSPTLFLLLATTLLRVAPVQPHVLARLGDARFRQEVGADVLTYAPDGRQLATEDGASVHLWAADGRRERTIALKAGSWVEDLCYSTDGKALFVAAHVGGRTRLLRIDPATGSVAADRELAAGKWTAVLAPDGSHVVLFGCRPRDPYRSEEDPPRGLRCHRTADGQELWSLPKAAHFKSVRFRPDGAAILADVGYGPLREYAAATGVTGPDINVRGFEVSGATYSPDGKSLFGIASVPTKGELFCWDLVAGRERWAVPLPRSGITGFLAGGKEVVVFGRGESEEAPLGWQRLDAASGKPVGAPLDMGLWDASRAYLRAGFPSLTGLAWHPDGKTVAVATSDGLIARWDLAAGKRLPESADPPTGVTHLRLTAGGTKVRGWARGWYEWDIKTGSQTRLPAAVDIPRDQEVIPSPDGRWLFRERRGPGRGEVAIEVVELSTGKVQALDPKYADRLIEFTADNRLAMSALAAVTVYDPHFGRVTTDVEFGFKTYYRDVAPDGSVVVAFDAGPTDVRGFRWDLRTGRKSAEWKLSETEASQLFHVPVVGNVIGKPHPRRALSRGGDLIVVLASRGGLLDTRTGRPLADWEGRPYERRFSSGDSDFAFRPDNRSFLDYARYPFEFKFTSREVATGAVRGTHWFTRPAADWSFTPDGRAFLVATRTHPVEIWSAVDPGGNWKAKAEADLWEGLADPDAAKGYAAIRHLWAHPTEAAAFLKARVTMPVVPPAEWVAGRIGKLDAARFRDREQATADLLASGEVVLPALRAAIPTASAEARERLDGLIAKIPQAPARLRPIRVCEVAEGLGTPAALDLLREWAKADAATALGREARASVERMGRR